MLLQPKRGLDRALVEIQRVLRYLLEPVCNAIGMLRPHRGERAEDYEIECALEDIGVHFFHLVIK